MVLRSFAVAREEGYVVMPGGLSRVAPSADTWVVSNQHGGVSKDVWVLASEPERQVSLLAPTHQPLALTRDGDDVPGRVADDLFWLGRYAERTEGGARLLREVLLRLLGVRARPAGRVAAAAAARRHRIRRDTSPASSARAPRSGCAHPSASCCSVLLDRKRTGSLRYNIDALVRAGRSVRDRLSSDTSRVINALNRELLRPCELDRRARSAAAPDHPAGGLRRTERARA